MPPTEPIKTDLWGTQIRQRGTTKN